MADNVPITPGSGATIGTDEVTIGGTLQHVQRVKLVDGTDGGTGLIGGDATNGLDVDVTRLPGVVNTPTDTDATNVSMIWVSAKNSVFDGTDWDRARTIGGIAAAGATTGIQAVGVIPHQIGYAMATATAQYTTTQTSTILGPTNAAGVTMYVTSLQIQATGTTGGNVQVYFGTGAYSRGTSRAIFDGAFIPSATSNPGVVITPAVPFVSVAGDECRVTTSAAINALTVTIWYYLVS